nr:uncharacterized protein LOC107419688 isoform X1 [Ziziphus jujuba var. spinosa]
MENTVGCKTNRLYTDFEPYCIWHKKEDTNTLDVHLEGFKNQQLKVVINDGRILTISGERPLDNNNKWSRFSKQIKLADNINVNDIRSKLAGGILSVVMPKKPEKISMSISLASEVIQTATKNAGGCRLEKDNNMGIKVGVVLVFLLLGFGIYVKCICGKSNSAMKNTVGCQTNRLYTDFEPHCIWHRKEDTDILDVHLDGFKKQQLKVVVNDGRILTISGERPLDNINNKWSRFNKQIKLTDNIKVNDIRSKLAGGILSVVMPRKPEIISMSISPESEFIQTATENAGGWRLKKDKNMAVNVGVVLVFLLLGFGIYVKCLSGKSFDPCAILKSSW